MKSPYLRKPKNGGETLLRLQRWPGLRKQWVGRKVYIYSNEHEAYWRANGQGYTLNEEDAGEYQFEDAYDRTKHCGAEKRITFRPANKVVSASGSK